MLVANLARFAIPNNLLFFIPHAPENTRYFVSHTNWMVVITSIFACLAIWVLQEPLRNNTSFDFLVPLTIYILLFINLDFIESYWLAKNQSKYVFYYSTFRTIFRLAAVIVTAAVSKSVEAVLNAMIAVEILRVIVTFVILQRSKILSYRVKPSVWTQQLSFVIPLGLASSVHYLNMYVGQVIISAKLGVAALAIYTIASYQVPILDILRSAISDAIFPDMVKEASGKSNDSLRLWKRGNVVYTFLTVPVCVVLAWYADVLIPIVFTDQYVDAIPIFRLLLLVMLTQCFELSSPLRAANRTGFLLASNLILLGVNIACIVIFFTYFKSVAIFGPAIGLVLGYVIQLSFLARCVTVVYSIGLDGLLKWRSLAIIVLCTALSSTTLLVGEYVDMPEIARLFVFSMLFAISYFTLIRLARLEEPETLIAFLTNRLRKRT
jgi:O-antigen/teichoic acid export membrane protein